MSATPPSGSLEEGLRDRAITRDIDLGRTDPARVGRQRASASTSGSRRSWLPIGGERVGEAGRRSRGLEGAGGGPGRRAYYFIGKDNIVFHTIIWPAMLIGHGGLNLPYDVPANQYVTFGGSR